MEQLSKRPVRMKTTTDPQLGFKLRSARKTKKLTLDELSELSGVSRSMVSQMERGQTNPTLGTLLSVTRSLGLDIGELIAQGVEDQPSAPVETDIEHVKAHLTPTISSPDGKCRIDILNPAHTASSVEWYEMHFEPASVLESDAHSAGAVEHLTVIDGSVDVRSGPSWVTVHKDETVRYRADREHSIANPNDNPATVIVVVLYGQLIRAQLR